MLEMMNYHAIIMPHVADNLTESDIAEAKEHLNKLGFKYFVYAVSTEAKVRKVYRVACFKEPPDKESLRRLEEELDSDGPYAMGDKILNKDYVLEEDDDGNRRPASATLH